ncbi:MAG: glycosyltransferase family 9 protein [Flavobacteriaceae bacterium]|nr:glycosyltransferase family 9 protein [Flavobacteriaceae bacterium]
MHTPKHILVIRLSAMGDVAMSVPVLRAFVYQNPEVKITVLSRAYLKPLFEEIPNVSFYVADVEGKHKGVFGLYKLSKELKSLKINAVADIHNVLRSKILRFFFSLSCLPSKWNRIVVINKGRSEKKALTRTENKIFKQLKSTHERYADVFRRLGFPIDLSNPQFPEKKNIPNNMLTLLGNYTKLIGIAPFAQYESKMYPLDLMEKIIAMISKNNNNKILLFGGGKNEIELLKNLADKFENTISLAGKVKLKDELYTISNLDCMVSMDSANAHLAAMLNVKTITLWGVTHPFTGFAPFNQSIKNTITPDLSKYPNIPCSIYGNKVCLGYENVMRTILPEVIIKKIMNLIK